MSSESLEKLYSHRFVGSHDYRNKVWAVIVGRFFQQFVSPDATVLDLGCGYCFFINNIVCARKYGIDLNPTAERLAGSDVTVLLHDSVQPWPVQPESVDIVFTSNFLEHMPTRPAVEKTVANAFEALKPGGRLIAMGPNIRFLPGMYWDFWDHYIPISDRSLAELLANQGFVVERSEPRFLPFSMVAAPRYPLFLLRCYLKCPFLWRLAGRQFLVVSRKPITQPPAPRVQP